MNKRMLLAVITALGSMVACTSKELRPPNWAMAVQTADTRDAHEALATHYEEVAKKLLDQAEEERQILGKYLADPHKYGKRILDLKASAQAETTDLELAAKESRQLAAYHRQMAAEAK